LAPQSSEILHSGMPAMLRREITRGSLNDALAAPIDA
jgi:hypothetical protein